VTALISESVEPRPQLIAEGVLVHQSELLQNNTVVVQGRAGVLLIDPGITGDEMAFLANDIRELDQPVVAGFATHPDCDHVPWHATLGCAPRVVHEAEQSLSVNDAIGNRDSGSQPSPRRSAPADSRA
jgi:glyoxylase-like metal-dependent hydrolase (beta-lactamase superfamily II)